MSFEAKAAGAAWFSRHGRSNHARAEARTTTRDALPADVQARMTRRECRGCGAPEKNLCVCDDQYDAVCGKIRAYQRSIGAIDRKPSF